MSQATAVAEALRLKATLERYRVRATVELKAGRPWSGDVWYTRKHVVMNHHTAGSPNGLTPSYAFCRDGHAALPGPLCNGYGGRDLVYRIITMGLANHPGSGGPLNVAGFLIPKDSARPSVWGTEWEHDGLRPWPSEMVDFMARSNAALDEFWGIPVQRQIEHLTWAPSRKIDRYGYTANRGQREVLAAAQSSGGFLMALPDQKQDEMYQWLRNLDTLREWGFVPDSGEAFPNSKGEITKRLRDISGGIGLIVARLDAQADQITEVVKAAARDTNLDLSDDDLGKLAASIVTKLGEKAV